MAFTHKNLLHWIEEAKSACTANPNHAASWSLWGLRLIQMSRFEKEAKLLEEAIEHLEESLRLDPHNPITYLYLGMAHLTILEIDNSSIYDEANTSEFVKLCKDGIGYFADALHCDSHPPVFYRGKIDEIVLLAEKKGIYLSVSWEKYKYKEEHEFVDVYENEDKRTNTIELKKKAEESEKLKNYERMKKLDKAETLKKDAKTILEFSGSIISQHKRTKYIAEAIAMLDEASLINPEDCEAKKEIDIAYALLSKEAEKFKSSTPAKGKGEASLSTNDNKKEENASLSAKETKILAPAKGEGMIVHE